MRTVLSIPGNVMLLDISRDGRMLLNNNTDRRVTFVNRNGEKADREITWFDWSRNAALSPDGEWLLFDEEGEGGGHDYTVYIRKTDGSPAVRLGTGAALALSPDGKWALATDLKTRQYILYPTGAGEQKQLTHDSITHEGLAQWTPDGKWIVFVGFEPGKKPRMWIMPAEGGDARPITPEGVAGGRVTPDGTRVLVGDADGNRFLYPLQGGAPTPVSQFKPYDGFVGWADAHTVYVREAAQNDWQLRVVKLDLNTGKRELFKEIEPPDRAGVLSLGPTQITPDGKTYVYGVTRRLSDLYIVEGLR